MVPSNNDPSDSVSSVSSGTLDRRLQALSSPPFYQEGLGDLPGIALGVQAPWRANRLSPPCRPNAQQPSPQLDLNVGQVDEVLIGRAAVAAPKRSSMDSAAIRSQLERPNYHRIVIHGDDGGLEMDKACKTLAMALIMRDKYRSCNKATYPSHTRMHREASAEETPPKSQLPPIHPVRASPGMRKARSGRRPIGSLLTIDDATPFPSTTPQESDDSDGDALDGTEVSPEVSKLRYSMVDGIVECSGRDLACVPISYEEYAADILKLLGTIEDGPCKSVCRNRLKILEMKYEMHITLNCRLEEEETSLNWNNGGGIFSSMKVDHLRLATCMNADELIKFIRDKVKRCPMDIVGHTPGGTPKTLKAFTEELGVTNIDNLTVDSLGLMPGPEILFHRFDIFARGRSRGGPGSSDILTLFLKAQNGVNGRYFAEIVKPVLSKKHDDCVATEMRVPIFGKEAGEWEYLAKWIVKHDLRGANHRWIIQIPRIAEIRESGIYRCETLQDQLDFIFLPMWRATLHPHEHPEIARVLREVGSVNIISDETTRGQDLPARRRPPKEWLWSENPPDIYFNYYVWANLVSLNDMRRQLGLNTFQFRPHCGEMGELDHLCSAYLLADSLYHGIQMQRNTVLMYLFYMSQIGVIMSPLSNNCLHLVPYDKNPFPLYAKIGLNVSPASDDPLHFHHSTNAILEEYGTCAKMYNMSSPDLCEVARNSVITSSFPEKWKERCLGGPAPESNIPSITHVPDARLKFRRECMLYEWKILKKKLRNQGADDIAAAFNLLGLGNKQGLRDTVDKTDTATDPIPPSPMKNILDLESEEDEKVEYHRVEIVGPRDVTMKMGAAVKKLREALNLRKKYLWKPPVPMWERRNLPNIITDDKDFVHVFQGGVPRVYRVINGVVSSTPHCRPVIGLEEYFRDFCLLHDIFAEVDVKALSQRRLELLSQKYNLHTALNALDEGDTGQRSADDDQHRDFYQSYKVDTHLHMAAGMTATQLLNFIMEKARNHSDDIVLKRNGQPITFKQLFDALRVDAVRLTVDTLNVQADATLFERFDNFNDKYNPMGIPDLRTLFLKTDNYMGGRYFAEIIKIVFKELERQVYTFTEGRLSIYGRSMDEWSKLSLWFDTHGMGHPHNKWMVQVPRIYHAFRKSGAVKSFGDMLKNIFDPLWRVSIDPASDPKLDHFLKHMSGFDSVDNESILDGPFPMVPPDEYTSESNPPYAYWMYYMWANITALNEFRSRKGMSTWDFRPHCGESGHTDHLVSCFITSTAINHGINLTKNPALEYSYYLAQIGLAVSPLSNNSLWVEYLKNPFPGYFRRGLNVSLSTDDPLQFHATQEPLVEEYSIASKIWKLSPTDMCEIARNSVRQSGFDFDTKVKWHGEQFFLDSALGNYVEKTHLPDCRVQYRYEVYHDEIDFLEQQLANYTNNSDVVTDECRVTRFMMTAQEEAAVLHEMRMKGLGRRSKRRQTADLSNTCGLATSLTGNESDRLIGLQKDKEQLQTEVLGLKHHIEKLQAQLDMAKEGERRKSSVQLSADEASVPRTEGSLIANPLARSHSKELVLRRNSWVPPHFGEMDMRDNKQRGCCHIM